MVENGTPSALALSRSMSSCSCGASSSPSGRTPASTLLCDAMPMIWLRAWTNAACPRPARSCRRKVKPVALPSSGIGGGFSGNTIASLICMKTPKALPAMASADCDLLRKHQTGILAATGEAETGNGYHVFNGRIFQVVVFDLLDHCERAVGAGTGRQLHVSDDVTLIFIRQEGRWQTRIQQAHAGQDQYIHDHVTSGLGQHLADEALIAGSGFVEATVEPAEETAFFVMMSLLNRQQDRGAQSWCERKCHQHGEHHGSHHRQRELAIDCTHGAAEEGHRDEHRDEYQRNADQSAGDLAHRFARGVTRR